MPCALRWTECKRLFNEPIETEKLVKIKLSSSHTLASFCYFDHFVLISKAAALSFIKWTFAKYNSRRAVQQKHTLCTLFTF